ncbi:hypothetical protein wcw_0570 [Waddlia chondrophila WSU 86-1044]|uniref:Uncharacterized protein n=1 Tax=Waddlia chondrophila (strain ATCC VR-1470 / WSU 86-1044) TaxID=716544 RepID=D6YUX9_WADCW|nr:hypothetical protein wcw_0570 [Waddlia chondrophila WSU 86-1044]
MKSSFFPSALCKGYFIFKKSTKNPYLFPTT